MSAPTPRAVVAALAAFVSLALATAGPALASGGGEGGGSLFSGDVGNMIWTLAIFLLVLFALGKFAWGPVLEGLKKREEFIHDSLAKAKADRDAAEARLEEYEKRLATARAEATAIVEEGRRDADALRLKIEQDARAESEKMIDRARREIGIAKETAIKELYVQSARLATDIAGRIVARELQPADHERLIRESLAELGRMESN
ncbi:MAG: F0F1 ATP synthase subunit B [Thermoanaerobaculia bacterium]|nr:F0F1 ATP synthase subunit B [Thermoanaerobaculia bacterium]